MNRSLRTMMLGLLCLPAISFAAETETISAASAANMGSNCFSCHGPEGKSPGAIPSLAGKSPEFIVGAMKEFKSGSRPATVMDRHAKGYSDAEIEAIAKYIGSLK